MKDNFRPSASQPNPPEDKRVYIKHKEHGEDMSHENESTITSEPREDRGELDLTLLIEQHQKEIWEWKQKESQWIRDKNQLDGNKKIIEELSAKLVEMAKANIAFKKRAQDAEEINKSHQEINGKLRTRLTEVVEDNKKLSKQIQDLTTSRKFGDGTH